MELVEKTATPNTLHEIPRVVGVYLFHGKRPQSKKNEVLYIGKAKNLQSRVRQYFAKEADARPFVKFLKNHVDAIHYIVVKTEQDALLLENELIKKYRPAYNIMLKDDKRFLSIRLDLRHEWPKLEVVRKIRRDGAIYLGPFSSSMRLRMTLEFMQKIFPLRTCSDHKLYNRSRPCLEYDIKRCVAPCVHYVTREQYQDLVDSSVMFLKGKTEAVVGKLKAEMDQAAEAENYEEASILRDKIHAIETTTTTQGIIGMTQMQRGLDQDAVGVAMKDGLAVIALIFIRRGIIFDKRLFEFREVVMDPQSLILEFVERYYSQEVYIPHEIWVPQNLNVEGLDLPLVHPRSEEKRNFLQIADDNARVYLESRLERKERMEATLEALRKKLHLSRAPLAIDCFDISHHQGGEVVASCVRFVEGQPEKSKYRKMQIESAEIDDFRSMQEALQRRYKSEDDLPDLIVIDGGRGQLSSAERVLADRGWLDKVDLVALAKARSRDGLDPLNPQNRERVFRLHQKNPVLLRENSNEERLLGAIRDEAHRFAITYHRWKKDEKISVSILDRVTGLGDKTKLKLLRSFGSIEGISNASDFELLKLVSEKTLQSLRLTLSEALGDDQ